MSRVRLTGGLLLASLLYWQPLTVLADAGAEARIKVFSRQLLLEPDNTSALLQRALAYVDAGQIDLALADLSLAQEQGDAVDADYVRGVIALRSNDRALAYQCFNRYLAVYPDNQDALGYRAQLARDLGHHQQALADYQQLLRLSPSLGPGIYIATARLVAELPDSGLEQALGILDRRMREIGPVSALQRYAVTLELQRGNYNAALQRMASLDTTLRSTPEWQVEVAKILIEAGRSDEARPYLEVALQQIDALRPTPARKRLKEEAGSVLGSLEE